MELFEIIIAQLLGGAALAALAKRVGAPYPALVALAGAGLALIPGLPTFQMDPELILALFIAPVLLDAAYDASPRDLKTHWRPVASLALGAVVITVLAVAVVARWLVPNMPWAAAIALGAIVAPPDAAAATTVLKQLRPPHRLLVILEGESLFNDASALLIFRLAVAATINGLFSGWAVLQTMLFVTIGSVVLGMLLSKLVLFLSRKIQDVAVGIVVQFCSTFAVWMVAERLHLSGIITVVVFGMFAARRVPEILEARMRVPAWSVWNVAVFVLNVLAFILIGLQLKSILQRTDESLETRYLLVAGAVCATVILARFLWVMGAAAFSRWRVSRCKERRSAFAIVGVTYSSALVIGWCGMRGTVTLAAALALPLAFPERDLILAAAFGVTIGTLVLQGLTLKPLIQFLGLKDDGSVEGEIRLARKETLIAAMKEVAKFPVTPTAALVRQSFDLQLTRGSLESELLSSFAPIKSDDSIQSEDEGRVIRAAFQAQRDELVSLRSARKIGEIAFQAIEEELDWMELGWDQLLRREGG